VRQMKELRPLDDTLCAVQDCLEEGQRQICPVDNYYHWHGRIHYEEGHPAYDLKFRDGNWYRICNTHKKVILDALGDHGYTLPSAMMEAMQILEKDVEK